MGRARDSAAQTTLRTAVAAAQAVYANMLPGGYNNYSGKAPVSGVIAAANQASVDSLNQEEPGITFETLTAYQSTSLAGTAPKPQSVWVQTIADASTELKMPATAISAWTSSTNKNPNTPGVAMPAVAASTSITAGDLVRMGVIAATGDSFCVILIGNDSHGRVSGEGWQATSEGARQAGYGADCGAEAGSAALPFREMPKTPGTDAKPSAIVDVATFGGGSTVTVATAKQYLTN
ncbi:MAG: hypothetical protein OXI96_01740 [Acidimicrobiaceae bacterium]|nr:hypothetical protein [Acidimicrobiaceae bacterium]